MKITKGTKLAIRHRRQGTYNAVALADFDTDSDEWASVAVDQTMPVSGASQDWHDGDEIPCRISLATFKRRT